MAGTILRHPPVAVDYWRLRNCANVRLFFLSHMHSDHTEGLTPSFSKTIYCSYVTRKLLLDQIKLNSDQVRGLELNITHCLSFGEDSDENLSVTLINANHCPGAVIFTFEGYFGRVVYTADFRYSSALIYDESFAKMCSSVVDELYLDNTFCSPRCNFPSREKAQAEVWEIISAHPDHRVMLGLHKLGKEELFVFIAKRLQLRIGVTKERFHTLLLLGMPDVFTTETSDSRIRIVDQSQINPKNMDNWNQEMPTIAIIPTALYTVLDVNGGLSKRHDVFVVSYSDHSSFSELCEFVSLVTPRAVIPILCDANDRLHRAIPERVDMSCFKKYLDTSPRPEFHVPGNLAIMRKAHREIISDQKISSTSRKAYKIRKLQPKGIVYDQMSDEEEQCSTSSSDKNNEQTSSLRFKTDDSTAGEEQEPSAKAKLPIHGFEENLEKEPWRGSTCSPAERGVNVFLGLPFLSKEKNVELSNLIWKGLEPLFKAEALRLARNHRKQSEL